MSYGGDDEFWRKVRARRRHEELRRGTGRGPYPDPWNEWQQRIGKLKVGEALSFRPETFPDQPTAKQVKRFTSDNGIFVRLATQDGVVMVHRVATKEQQRIPRGKYGRDD